MIQTVIIEDEIAAHNHLKNLLENKYGNQITIVGHETSVKNGIKLIEACKPQLVFLDIQLEDGTGFDLLDYFSDNSTFEVIFTTGLIDYKEKAMDYFAFYYLNKPIQENQLIEVLNKFLAKQSAFDLEKYLAFKNQLENKHKKISLPINNGGFAIIDIDAIVYCEADGSYTNFYTADGKVYITSNNLKKVENLLQQSSFFRIHRSTLLNLKHVAQYNNSGKITLTNKKTLMVSSRNKKNFLRILKLMSYSLN